MLVARVRMSRMRTIAGMEVTMTMNTELTISAVLDRAEEQMTMTNLAENTRKAYRLEIRRFFDHIGKPVCEIGAEDVRGWVLGRIESGLSPGSCNMTAAAMRFLFRDTLDRPEMVKGVRNQRMPRKLPRHMAVKEIERLTMAVTDIRYRTAIVLSYGAGLRISETVAVKVTDIRAGKNLLHIPAGKGGTERTAPLPKHLIDYLRGYWKSIYPRPVSWMFYANAPEAPISTDSLRKAFNTARDRVGISDRYTFHCLRHSFAAHVHERGGSIDVIQDALGHRKSDTTRGYARATGRMFASLDHPLSGSALIAS